MIFKIIKNINADLIRLILAINYGSWFIYIGIQHFLDPDWFEPIVPKITIVAWIGKLKPLARN